MNDPRVRETILYAFAVEPSHDQETLERYLRQYPGLADDLIDLSYELRLTETLGPSGAGAEADPGWQDAWQQFVACGHRKTAPAKTGNPFARFKGKAFADLAESLKVPRSILAAVRDRLADPSSIPERFVRQIVRLTGSTMETVQEYLLLPPTIISAAQFEADKNPSHQGQVSFENLVQNSEITDEQRKVLLQEWGKDDGPDRG